ncbi:MAG: hypothetical protein IPM56_05525 [Ignavibacteriales bacterium]|nr:MAG: hypothetical protein IPM56_05525 [Ignavibacteriales bacterium]
MKKNILIFPVMVLLILIGGQKLFAQCSDAGVCSISGHHSEEESTTPLTISASYKFGSSGKDEDVKFHSLQLGAGYNLFDNSSVQLSLPYNIQSGPAGNVSGIGDLILSWTQKLFYDGTSSLDASVGVKLALGDDNKDNLPQVYQSSLGTNDLLIALNYTYDKISIGAGYQLAGGRNNNLLKLERGDDILLRGAYELSFEKFRVVPQLLFIKRLSKSSIVNFLSMAPAESYIDVEKSDQSQLNLLTMIEYSVNENYSLFADVAVPFLKREVNVDGLTRAFSASVGIKLLIE